MILTFSFFQGSNPEKVEILFVTQAASSPLLALAHKAVSCYQNIKSSSIDEQTIIRTKQVKQPRTYFVLSTFEGTVFKHLRTQGCPILGPHVILHYLRENAALPAWPLPLFSAAMQQAMVTFTSVGLEKRKQLSEMVRMMHGETTGDFTSSVTVIVSPKIGSRKFYVGNQVGVPVVLPSWIEESWKLSEIQVSTVEWILISVIETKERKEKEMYALHLMHVPIVGLFSRFLAITDHRMIIPEKVIYC